MLSVPTTIEFSLTRIQSSAHDTEKVASSHPDKSEDPYLALIHHGVGGACS